MQAIIDAVETIDQTPTAGSKNPVESGGVAAALEGVETALQGVDDALEAVDTRIDGVDTRIDGVDTALAGKQATLVSGTNIKTINGQSVLGIGNLRVGDSDAVKNLAGSASAYTTVIKAGNSESMTAEVRMVDASVKAQAAGGSVEVNASGVALQAGNSGAPNAKVTYNGQEVATKKYVDDAIEAIDVTDQIAGKADKVSGAVSGDFAGLDSQGNLTDSGKKASDFATAAQGAKADAAAPQATTYNKTEVDGKLAGKADKVSGAVSGDFAGLDANGNLTDSGKKASDFATAAQGAKADAAAPQATTYNKTEVDAALAGKADASVVATNTEDIAKLQEAYVALTQSDVVIGPLPAAGSANVIYRVPGTSSYSDYMWDSTQFVPMATYDNAIDDVPVEGSGNLVKSGGVYAELYGGEVYDLPSGLTELNWQTTTRKIYYADGALTFYTNGVQGCHIGQAASDAWTNNANWKIVDSSFWDGDETLVAKVRYNLSQDTHLRIYVKRGESGSLGYPIDIPTITSGEGVSMIDVKALLMGYFSTGYRNITHITFGAMYATSTSGPYGVSQMEVLGFERSVKGVYDILDDLSSEISQGVGALNKDMLATINGSFFERPFYGHCFISQISASSTPLIPCQSLMDVDAAKRLGFKYIELNVQRTSDNQLIAIHGVSGAFGGQVYHINNVDISSTQISSVTYDYIRQYVRYRAMYAKDRVTIPLLSDVLKECKRLGISVMITYSEDARALADKYIGENRWIAYGGLRGSGYGGMVMNYSPLATQAEIVELCESIKPPYIHMLNTAAFATFRAAGTLQELADAVHVTGCLLGLASCYQSTDDNIYFFENGGDVGASDNFVNFPESGNLINANGAVDFSDFAHTGSVADGVLSLPIDGTLTLANQPDNVYLGKGYLEIRFNGSLKIASFGRSTANTVISSGGELKTLSTYFQNAAPTFSLVATETTDIYMIHYKASKC